MHDDEIKKMKDAFKRELQMMIENEIKEHKRESMQQEKLKHWSLKTNKLDEEKKHFEEVKQMAK